MRILIVEDSAVDSLILRNILSHSGHAPTVVKSGEEALKELEAHPEIDLVLSDIFMPGMDGIQLLESMRQDPCLAHVPLMFTSGASEAETVHRAAALRPDGYMLKPFTEPSRVLARVEKAVQNAPVVMLDSNAIRSRTGLGSTGVKELLAGVTQEFTHVLEAATDPGHAVASTLKGLALSLGAERLLKAMDDSAAESWRVGGRIHRELRAVLNCVADSAA